MKIIKQNDSAGGLIFKQNTNGKSMKQNYNFGKGFYKSEEYSVYIQLPSGILNAYEEDWTIMAFIDDDGVNSALFTIKDNSNASVQYAGTYSSLNLFFYGNGGIYNITDNSKNNLCGLRQNSGVITPFSNNNISMSPANQIASNNPPYTIFAGATFNDPKQSIQRNHLVRSRMNDFTVYNRFLQNEEILYVLNNRLGNEQLSALGTLARYTFDAFDIKQFDGVDAVCAVDVSGTNNHGKLIGLPAGTLAEQLSWANLNCLK